MIDSVTTFNGEKFIQNACIFLLNKVEQKKIKTKCSLSDEEEATSEQRTSHRFLRSY